MKYTEHYQNLSNKENIHTKCADYMPPIETKQLLSELERLYEYFRLAEPYYKQKKHLKWKLENQGEFVKGFSGFITIIYFIILLFIIWIILGISYLLSIPFLAYIYSFINQYSWTSIFLFCIGFPIFINIINRSRLKHSKSILERELKDIEYKIDEIFINAPHNFIDKKYANSYIIKNLIQYIKENRARTYQEALNLYIEDKKYNNLLNEVYRTQQEARWSNIK